MGTTSSQGLIARCDYKKRGNVQLVDYISGFVPDKSLVMIAACGSWLHIIADSSGQNRKLLSANFCKNRFCPMCAWRKACKDAVRFQVLLDYVRYRLKKEVVMLTLTAPNVPAARLQAEVNRFNDDFKKLLKREEVLQICKGYIRKLEITYNQERDDYHPHFHILLAVNKSYFTDKTYISHERWLELWQEVTGDDSITQVDARKFRGSDVREIAKYAAKDSDYLVSRVVFEVLYWAIKGRRIVTYGGVFTEVNKLYKAKAPELDDIKQLQADTVEYMYKLMYRWGVENYGLVELRELTEDERRDIMNQAIDDCEVDDD